jgi:hypothetical protein
MLPSMSRRTSTVRVDAMAKMQQIIEETLVKNMQLEQRIEQLQGLTKDASG